MKCGRFPCENARISFFESIIFYVCGDSRLCVLRILPQRGTEIGIKGNERPAGAYWALRSR